MGLPGSVAGYAAEAAIMFAMRQHNDGGAGFAHADGATFGRALDAFVAEAAQATTWQVERLLKRSAFEMTELVDGAPADGAPGRYVRKRIACSAGVGSAYEVLYALQRAEACPRCVPRLVECVRMDDELTVVMEYVEGVTVEQLVRSIGPGAKAARLVMPPLCNAVQALHDAYDPPLIHRDIKPSNIMMRAGEPVLIEFGCARVWRPGADSDTAHFLTRCYAPPEQFGFGQTDVRSDVYALGKVLYFCMTGEQPPNVCDEAALQEAGVPAGIARVVARACAFDPDQRFDCARALGAAIADALDALDALGEKGGAPSAPRTLDAASELSSAPDAHVAPADAEAPSTVGPFGAWTDAWLDGLQERAGALRHAAQARMQAMEPHARVAMRPVRRLRAWARAPRRLGRLWNAVAVATYICLVAGSIMAIASPNARDALLPLWFRVLEYVLIIDVGCLVICYFLLDRRDLYRRIPALAQLGLARQLLIGFLILTLCVLVPALLGTAAGLL